LKTGYFYFEGCQLEVPIDMLRKEKIDVNASHQSFLASHLKDVSLELSCLKYLASKIKGINSYLDLMAGSGFSAKLIQKIFSPSEVWLNDFSPDSFDCLNHNFNSDVEVTQGDANKVILKDKQDLIFVDFNTFTLKHIDYWGELFGTLKGRFHDLWFVDTASFASLFGEKSFKQAYGVSSLVEYYSLLEGILEPYKMYIHRVACFRNRRAAVVHVKPMRQKSFDLEYVGDSVGIQMSKVKGFDF